jgi:uncharacterized surface protein with fasciclin (FAS1) repeats
MPTRHARTRIALATLTGTFALLAAACGDDASTAGSSPTTAADTAAPSTTAANPATTASTAMSTTTAASGNTIVDVATKAGSFTVLVQAVKAAGLAETLTSPGPFTVFAPTDAAFQAALTQLGMTADQLLADKTTLQTILKYHVVAGEVKAADVVKLNGQQVATVAGPKVQISVSGSQVMVNDAKVTQADVDASNGVIHVIDQVLLPPAA